MKITRACKKGEAILFRIMMVGSTLDSLGRCLDILSEGVGAVVKPFAVADLLPAVQQVVGSHHD